MLRRFPSPSIGWLSSVGISNAWREAAQRVGGMVHGFIVLIPNLVLAIGVFVLFFFAGRLARTFIHRFATEKRKHRNVALVMGRLAHGVTLILGVLVACVIVLPNFTPASLVQFLGIGSVAIGFAFREVLQNYLAGILLLLTEPFRIGDQIIFGGFEGTVEDIQARATLIRTYDNRRVQVPNGQLFTQSFTVNTAYDKRRLEYDLGIGYGDSISRARDVILKALHELDEVLNDPRPEVLAYALAESSVTLRVRWWVQPPRISDALASRDRVMQLVKERLSAAGIDMPFPTRQILFHNQTEEADGDRARQREGWPNAPGAPSKPREKSNAER